MSTRTLTRTAGQGQRRLAAADAAETRRARMYADLERAQDPVFLARVTREVMEARRRLASHASEGAEAKGDARMSMVVARAAGDERPVETRQLLTLADRLYNDGLLPWASWIAAQRYRQVYLTALGGSAGVGDYGERTGGASAPWARAHAKDHVMQAQDELGRATVAMCGLVREDRRPCLDEALRCAVLPAIVSDEATRNTLAEGRTLYAQRGQVAAAGTTVLAEALQRLALYWGYVKSDESRGGKLSAWHAEA